MRVHLLILTLLFIGIISCITINRNFTIYKLPLSKSNCNTICINGVYFPISYSVKNAPTFIYFYKDGTVSLLSILGYNIKNYNNFLNESLFCNNDANTGNFYIINKDIHIQCFGTIDEYFIKHNTYDIYGKVINDSTIQLIKCVCTWCEDFDYGSGYINNEYIYNPTIEYHFYKHSFKPDSSKFWFRNKKWYIKGLKEREQIEEKMDSVNSGWK